MFRTIFVITLISACFACVASCTFRAASTTPQEQYYDTYNTRFRDSSSASYYSNLRAYDPARQVVGLYATITVPETAEEIAMIKETCAEALAPEYYNIDFYKIPLGREITNIAAEAFSLASSTVEFDPTDEEPNALLDSDPFLPAIAVYHFDEVRAGDTVTSISIDSLSKFHGPANRGFYLGYRSDDEKQYVWYGPFHADSSWLLPLYPQKTTEATNPSLAVVTAGGNSFDMRSLTVMVDNYEDAFRFTRDQQAEMERRMYDLERERQALQWERWQLYEEWQRLEDEYDRLRQRDRFDHYDRPRDNYDDRHLAIEVPEVEHDTGLRLKLSQPK